MSYTTPRKRNTNKAQNAKYSDLIQRVEAKSVAELAAPKGSYSQSINGHLWGRFANVAPTWSQIILGYTLEMIAAFVIGLTVVLVNVCNTDVSGINKGVINGLVKGVLVWGFSRLPIHTAVKPHLTITYLTLSTGIQTIGWLGALMKLVAMFIGTLLGGLVMARILLSGISVMVINNAVSFPQVTYATGLGFFGVNLATVICFELFMPLFIHLASSLVEHVGSDESTEQSRRKHYKKGRLYEAVCWFIFVTISTPFGAFMFDFSPYVTGLFTGVSQLDGLRNSVTLLYQRGLENPDGVWNQASINAAAPLVYIFMPIVAGLVLSAIVVVWIAAGETALATTPFPDNPMRKKEEEAGKAPEDSAESSASSSSNDFNANQIAGAFERAMNNKNKTQ